MQYERQCENERILGIENSDADDTPQNDMEARQTDLDNEFISRGSVGGALATEARDFDPDAEEAPLKVESESDKVHDLGNRAVRIYWHI